MFGNIIIFLFEKKLILFLRNFKATPQVKFWKTAPPQWNTLWQFLKQSPKMKHPSVNHLLNMQHPWGLHNHSQNEMLPMSVFEN